MAADGVIKIINKIVFVKNEKKKTTDKSKLTSGQSREEIHFAFDSSKDDSTAV